jgi:speckle-type POZ protein
MLKESLVKLRNNPKFSDVTLNIDGKLIPAHKCLLASRSGKFKMMLESNMAEQDSTVIKVETTKPVLMSSIIDWIYSSEIDFPATTADIFELILMADEYLLDDLKRKCEETLMYRLEQDNALEILVMSFKYHTIISDNLVEYAIAALIDDFDDIIEKTADLEDQIKGSASFM